MSAVSRTVSWVRALFRRDRTAQEVVEEMRFHVDACADDLIRQGVPPAEARRRARAEMGMASVQGERYRDAIGLRACDEIWGDVRYGLRGLWRSPGFAAIAIVSLGLSIGTATAMFSLVHAVLLDVYPYADHERTVNPIVHDPAQPDDWRWFILNGPQYKMYKSARAFEDVFGMTNLTVQLDEEDVQENLRATLLTSNASHFMQVPALLGRSLQASDGDHGDPSPNIVVLGYKFWLKHYGGDKSVLKSSLKIGTTSYTIVGVMPARYTLGGTPDVYMPMSELQSPDPYYIAFAKLKPGVTPEQASAEVDPMLHEFAKQHPLMYPQQFHARLQLLIDGFTDRSKFVRSLPLLFLTVSMLLLIGCANCSILLMARGTARTHEFALRAAIGASRFRMVRQLLVECLTISLLGAGLGVGLAYFLAKLPLQLAPDLFPSESVVRVDPSVLGFSVAVAVVAGLVFGLWPALRFSRPQISQVLQASSRTTAAGGGQRPLRVLIGAQIALTLVLLTVAGAAITGFVNLMRLNLGYDPTNMTFVNVAYMNDTAKTWAERGAKAEQFRQTIEAVPGVVSAAVSDDIPPSGGGTAEFKMVGEAPLEQTMARQTDVGPNYFSVMRIPVLQGRVWNKAECGEGLPLAVVNEAFVRRYSPGRSVLGRRVRLARMDPSKPPEGVVFSPLFTTPDVQIVGVVGDAINDGLDKPVLPNIYVNANVLHFGGSLLLVRTEGDPHQYSRAIEHALRQSGQKNYVFISPYSLKELVERDESWRQQRLISVLFGIFAAISLILALVGLYSVAEYVVAQRRVEFGIRMALGAQRMQILWLVLRSNVLVILGGGVAGLLLSLALRREFERWSAGSSRNPEIVVGAAVLMAVVALAACLVPARRAACVEPYEALRSE